MITPFSIVFIMIVIFTLCREKKVHDIFITFLAVTMTIQVCSLGGYFVKLGTVEIDYVDIAMLLTAFFGFLDSRNCINRKTFILSMALLGWSLLGMILTSVLPPHTQIIPTTVSWDAYFYGRASKTTAVISVSSIMAFIKLGLSLFILCFSGQILDDDYAKVRRIIVRISKVHIVWLVVEVVSKNILKTNLLPNLRNTIFGIGKSTATELTLRGSGYTVFGWTREASAVPEFLFVFIAIIILSKTVKENKYWIIAGVMIMALSMSFSTLMFGSALILLYAFSYQGVTGKKASKKAIYGGTALLLLVCAGIYFALNNPYYSSRVTGFIEDFSVISSKNNVLNGTITSSKVRLYGIMETLNVLLERPLTGFGLGTAYCNSAVVMILADIGIIGFTLWISAIGSISRQRKPFLSKNNICFCLFLLLPNILKGSSSLLYTTSIILVLYLIDNLNTEMVRGGVRQAKDQLVLILSFFKGEFQKVLQNCYFSEREVAML